MGVGAAYTFHPFSIDVDFSGTGSIRDIGFLASCVQLFAASVFWISTLYVRQSPVIPFNYSNVHFQDRIAQHYTHINGKEYPRFCCTVLDASSHRRYGLHRGFAIVNAGRAEEVVEDHSFETRMVRLQHCGCPSLYANPAGRQVAFWNLIGAIGFTLCGALGYAAVTSTKVRWLSLSSIVSVNLCYFRPTIKASCLRFGEAGRS